MRPEMATKYKESPLVYENSHADSAEDKQTDDAGETSEWYYPLAFCEKRHCEKIEGTFKPVHTWRMKERMKTVSVAIVLCLNVGVDPPDVLKIQPCARMECWLDPLAMGAKKALECIGNTLQKQYEKWQPRARSKVSLDPTLDEVKKLCQSLRRNAKEERVLFHYNGHGVPKPTDNGEIWVFNKNYTQYIPLSLFTLQSWMGTPSIYVFDCSNAGLILEKLAEFQQQRDCKLESASSVMSSSTGSNSDTCRQCILLGACGATELLPQQPFLPADLFTSCLTTPIHMALHWFVQENPGKLVKGITQESMDRIPGQLNDRRTMLGELNWIFTAITDTIAWNVLPRETFQKLFRQDLLVASLFRNLLLAERIMRSYNCTPVSNQKLPSTYQHPMWQAWDYTLDSCISQLPAILEDGAEFQFSPFFAEQLTAFQVWLEYGTVNRSPPEQLPIVLQVLLSQVHRLRALDLLSRFLDHGPHAVSLALSVGIFPYVLKLLQSSARELRPLLVFIWAKILSVDNSCQMDLVKDEGHKYFLCVVDDQDMPSEHRTMAVFVLAMIVNNYPSGQSVLHGNAISVLLLHLEYRQDHRLRQWCALCLGKIWLNNQAAKSESVRDLAHEKLYRLLDDDHPDVRAAAIFALGTFINQCSGRTDYASTVDHSVGIKLCSMADDCSPVVRRELVSAFAGFVAVWESHFISAAYSYHEDEIVSTAVESSSNKVVSSPKPAGSVKSHIGSPFSPSYLSSSIESALDSPGLKRVSSHTSLSSMTNVFSMVWRTLIVLAMDPFPFVHQDAGILVNKLKNKALINPKTKAISIGRSSVNFSAPCSPTGRASYPRTESSSALTPGTKGSEPNPAQPEKCVSTDFFAWSCRMFETPMLDSFCTYSSKDETNDDKQENKRVFFDRNVKMKELGLEEQLMVKFGIPIDTEIFANKIPCIPTILRFHPYDIMLAVANSESVGIWDWEAGVGMSSFYNHNSKSIRITGLEYINHHQREKTLLAVGTDDGAVRVWKDFNQRDSELQLVTSWQAISDLSSAKFVGGNSPGMVMNWQQHMSWLFVSGSVRYIRLFDVQKEMHIKDMMTGSDSCVTSLSCDPVSQHRVIASCGDKTVRIFDTRLPSSDSRVHTFQHSSWVLNCQQMKGSEERLVSAEKDGMIKIWDLRKQDCVESFSTEGVIRSMAYHKGAELIACGMADQEIRVYTKNGYTSSSIKYHDGFMQQRVARVNCLAFHPHLVRLASGNVDGMVTVYGMSDKSRR